MKCGICKKPIPRGRKYCSKQCSGIAVGRRGKSNNYKNCPVCKKEFHSAPSQKRIYCSYECHIKSGGALRAGKAATRSRRRNGKTKKDYNHDDMVSALEKMGANVIDCHAMGSGFPDTLIWVRGSWYLCEIKNPETSYGKKGLNPLQQIWAENWKGGAVFILRTIDDAKCLVEGKLEKLERFGGSGA